MWEAIRDKNFVPTAMGVSSEDSTVLLPFKIDPVTGRLLVMIVGGSGTGDVVWPTSATNNALARFDTATGKLLQNSGILVDDSNNVSGINNLAIAGNFATPYANTITVAKSGGDYDVIQDAINASVNGEPILIYDGIYSENITTKAGAMTTLVGMGTMGSVIIEANTGSVLTVPSAMMSMAFIKNIKLKSTATGNNSSKLIYGEGTMTTFKDVSFDYNISNGYTEEIIDLEAGNYVFSGCRFDYDSTGTNGGMNTFISASGSVNYNIMQGYGTMSIASTSPAEHLHFIGDSSSNNNLIRDFDCTIEATSASYGGHLDFIHSTNTGNIESLGNKIAITTPSGVAGSYGQAYHLAGSGGGHIHSTSNNIEIVWFGSDYIGNINATETLYSHFDDIVAVDNIIGDGTYSYVNSPSDWDLQMSGNIIKKLLNITADYDETESWEFGILSANSSTIDIKATLNSTYFAGVPSGATKTFINAGTTKNFILDPNGATWGGSTEERVIYPGGYIIMEKVGGEGIIIASHNTSFNIDIASIDNPSFHVDFSDASSVTVDGSSHITQVVDSVNGWNGTPSASTGVEYGTTTQNGLNTAKWDTANTPLSFGDNDIHNNTAGRGMTIIAVVKADNSNDAIMSKYYDATPQREWRMYTSNVTIYSNLDASGNEAIINYSSNYGEWQILQIEWVPWEGATAYKNGFLMGTSSYDVATIPAGTADLLMGASDLTGADFAGEIGEVWAFSNTLTADERDAVTSKLGAKWDIDTKVPSSSDSSPFGRNSDTNTIKPLIDNDNLDIGTGAYGGVWQGEAIEDTYIDSASTWNAKPDNLQEAFDGGQSITIANGDNKTFSITNNDVTNTSNTFTVTSSSWWIPLVSFQNSNNTLAYFSATWVTTTNAFRFLAPALTTGNWLEFSTASARTGGNMAIFYDASTSTTADTLQIRNAGSWGCWYYNQKGNWTALTIDSEAISKSLINLQAINTNTRWDIAFNTARTSDPSSPSEWDMWYNSTSNQFKGYNGSSVVVLG